MPNTETVRALVSAFNVHNYARNTVKTNFTLQSDGKKDYIVVSFDKSMDTYQCRRYLDSIKRKIVGEFYGIEEGDTDEVVLNTANLIFNIESFPFNTSKGKWSQDEQGRIEFLAPTDKGVIFNLKSHLASSLAKDVREDIRVSSTTVPFTKGEYLCCSKFPHKELRKQFEREFLSRMRERYENVPKNPLKVKDDDVYIKDVFDDARFIDSVTRRVAWLKGMGLQDDSKNYSKAKAFKDLIIEFIDQSTGLTVAGFIRNFPLNEKIAKILIPVVLDNGEPRILASKEALKLSYAFNYAVFNNLYSKVQAELPINGSSGIYGIDFSNPEISHSVITKIIENSVINAKHELSIDPELPRTLLTESSLTWGLPTWNQDVADGSPRQGSEKGEEIRGDFQLLPGEEIGQTSASSQQTNHLSSPPSAEFSSCSSSGSSSSRGADKSGSAWTSQPIGFWSSPTPSAEPSLWQPSRPLSRKGANESGSAWTSQPIGYWSSQSSNVKEDCKKIHEVFEEAYEKIVSGSSLSEKEEKLSKALLYWFNLNNYALDPPHTNFIVKNGKIASLIDDSVNVKEYLQEVIDKTKEEYRVNEKEGYDLNEFPFKFLSNCKKNQETTVVANISRGALLNLKKLFSREHEGKVEIKDIDINIVEKAVKSEKNKWVNFQVQEHGLLPQKAIETCYPDESALEYISITKDKGGYWINRNYDASEVRSFRKEQWPAKGTRNTTTTFKKIEESKKDDSSSGYSSGFVTDAENVSSKAEAITSSGYESMDCENTRGGSPKRKSPSPEDRGSPRKSPKRDSLPLSRLESLSLSSSSHQIDKC